MKKLIVFYKLFLLLFIAFNTSLVFSQNTVPADSTDNTVTPFRKGRWLTSFSGSISSTNTELKSTQIKTISNEFGINLSTGKFFKERWLFGVVFQASREQAKGDVNVVGESFFIGPQISRYFSKTKDGSLYLNISPSFVLFRSLATIEGDPDFREEADGNGFGAFVSLGYSYVIQDLIFLNIGFNVQSAWVSVDTSDINGFKGSDNITLSNMSFTFGFGVILDDFFF
jgi:hypothetical protein